MPASTELINNVAIALEIPLTPNFLQDVEWNLNYIENSAGSDFLTTVQDMADQILSLNNRLTESASSGKGNLIKADVLEWESGGSSALIRNEIDRLAGRLANLLQMDYLRSRSCRTRILR